MIAQVLARNWWLLALRGALAILFGALAIVWPVQTIVVVALLFGAYMLIDGLVAAWYGLLGHRGWWLVVQGLLGVGVGIVTLLIPGITAVVLVYLIAFWAILRGIAEIVVATQIGREAGRELLLILAGMLSVLFGVAIIFFPGAGMLAIVWLIGAYAIVLGILLVAGAFHIRTWVPLGRPQLG